MDVFATAELKRLTVLSSLLGWQHSPPAANTLVSVSSLSANLSASEQHSAPLGASYRALLTAQDLSYYFPVPFCLTEVSNM